MDGGGERERHTFPDIVGLERESVKIEEKVCFGTVKEREERERPFSPMAVSLFLLLLLTPLTPSQSVAGLFIQSIAAHQVGWLVDGK